MKILLFGATGLFGTELERICVGDGVEFVGLSHTDVDVTDHGAVIAHIDQHKPTVVVNAVAIVGIDPCEQQPGHAYAVNAAAPLAMALHCARQDTALVQTSTHAVFDGTKTAPYTEEDLPNPISVYSLSKFAGECFVRDVCAKHYVVRFPTMYGTRRNSAPGFVDKMVARLQAGSELRVADDKFDSPSYAHDTARQTLDLLKDQHDFGTYHVANEGYVSFYDFISMLKDALGADNPVYRAKDSDFPGLAHKPLRTAIASARLPALRCWQDALEAYVRTSPVQV